MTEFQDRRRLPRVALKQPRTLLLNWTTQVQVVDVSSSGVLLACPIPMPPGARAAFRTMLGQYFTADLRIIRTAAVDRQEPLGVRLGAAFTAVDPDSQRVLASFLNRAGNLGSES